MVDNEGVICDSAATCAVCGAAGRVTHAGLSDREFAAPGVWSLRECGRAACGLGWLDPRPRKAEIGKLYQSYWTHDGETTDAGEPVPSTVDSVGVKLLAKRGLAALIPWRAATYRSDRMHLQGMAPGRLLDIGCGNGGFLGGMARVGWQAHGIDFDPAALAVARRFPGVTTALGDVFDQGFDAESFDAVTMSNVIEHVPDPVETIAECRRILRPGGRLVVITPNLRALGHEIFGADWRGLESPRHLFLFQGKTLRALAARAEFGKISVFSTPGSGPATDYIIAASHRNARANGRSGIDADAAALNRRERLLDILGRSRGEWVTMVATR
ncbi:class I SAM-dependent methyltransferase [uncultured Sphingomonas sp.]|uniref:class I SAM-dependent methyltransferase n=1 Tax=uncultured Sphingomonas sp. TaxID=158754 RepID=UPI0035CAE239